MLYPANERGKTRAHWLKSYHTFSFAEYFNPAKMNFGPIRVLNDDTIAPKSGFSEHPHKDMEIITLVLEGEITHRDSTGAMGVTRAGEMQIMTAGSGVRHSEINYHDVVPCKLLQIWIEPNKKGLTPSYFQFDIGYGQDEFRDCISGSAEREIHADAILSLGEFEGEHQLNIVARHGAFFLFVIEGEVSVNGELLQARDAIGLETDSLELNCEDAKVLLFDVSSK